MRVRKKTRSSKKENALAEKDVRGAFRVILDSLDHGYDPITWRKRLLSGVAALIDAHLCLSDLMPTTVPRARPDFSLMVFYSPHSADAERWSKHWRTVDMSKDPVTPAIMQNFLSPQTTTVDGLIPRSQWLKSPYVQQVYLSSNVYDWIHSRIPSPANDVVSILGFTRRKDQPLFGAREVRLVELVHQELMNRVAVPDNGLSDASHTLPLRLQEIATHLRGPMSEKEIAKTVKLSLHTVHNYVKAIYRRLRVTTRSEAVFAMKSREGRSRSRHEVVVR